jgi:hypothetical protein
MPVLDIVDRNGGLRWDAAGCLEAVIYFPRKPDLRGQYEARWRAEHKALLPLGRRFTTAATHDPARSFGGRELDAMRKTLAKRRVRAERIGTALWFQAYLSKTDPPHATESRVGWVLSEIAKGDSIRVSRSTIKRDWSEYRGVVHWCAAVAYQRRVFGAPLLYYPSIGPLGYSADAALWDFLRLGHEFFLFASESGCFTPTKSFDPQRDLWTLPPDPGRLAPRREITWPDYHRVRSDVPPNPDVLELLPHYDATLYRG